MINFYVLSYDNISSSLKTICKIIEKAFTNQHKIFVYCPNQHITNDIDHTLWTFKEESFIGHTTSDTKIPHSPIYINHLIPSAENFTVIINLTDNNIEPNQYTKKIVEFVYNDNMHKELSRKKFEIYKNKNIKLTTYKI